MTDRFQDALIAFKSDRFDSVLRTLINVREVDADRSKDVGKLVDPNDVVASFVTGYDPRTKSITYNALASYDDATLDAVMVVMYAGRDGDYDLPESGRYDHDRIEDKFTEWWDYLTMDGENHVLTMLREKKPLDRYLRAGIRMFRIDER